MTSQQQPPVELYQEDDVLGAGKQQQQQQQQQPPARRRIEYYAEENFQGARLGRSVHLGWGAVIGGSIILFCMGMSALTQGQSWNVSFRWLQRRVGAQFGTMAYIITSNAMYYHDGDRWLVRPAFDILSRYKAAARPLEQVQVLPPTLQHAIIGRVSRGFAADAV